MHRPMTPERPIAPVSLVIIARDAGRTLQRCLASTEGLPDVLLLDTGSTDDSLSIAHQCPWVRQVEGPFVNFSDARNRAAALARYDWICPLDSDEWLDPVLAAALRDFRPVSPNHVHAFWRHNWMLGAPLRSRLGREWIRRVYHRQQVRFEGAVHEQLRLRNGGGRPAGAPLPGFVGHDPYADLGQLFHKRWVYARPELRGTLKAGGPFKASLRAFWRFLQGWLFKGGLRDGWRGFALASADAYGVFLKYLWAHSARRCASDVRRPSDPAP